MTTSDTNAVGASAQVQDDLLTRLCPHPRTRDDAPVLIRARNLREAVDKLESLAETIGEIRKIAAFHKDYGNTEGEIRLATLILAALSQATKDDAMGEREGGCRVAVTGGRDYRDREHVFAVLDELYPVMSALIVGDAPGADTMAWDWSWRRRFTVSRFHADWKTLGRAAGPVRNQRMIDEGKPDLLVAFPGGRGTADMIRRAEAAGIAVRRESRRPATATSTGG